MQGEDRHFDGEGEEEGGGRPAHRPGGKGAVGNENLKRGEVEAARPSVEPEQRHQQRRGGDEGEEEELDRGAGAVLAAVDGDQNGHGNKRQLPKREVEHQVQREEDAEDRRLLDQEERIKDLAPFPDGLPTGHHADGSQKPGEHHQPEAQTVHAEVVEDGGILDPRTVGLELETGLCGDKMCRQVQRQSEGGERGEEGNPVGQLGAVGHKRHQNRSGDGHVKGRTDEIGNCHHGDPAEQRHHLFLLPTVNRKPKTDGAPEKRGDQRIGIDRKFHRQDRFATCL